ncbi:MAG: hypothetical protein J7L15_08690, partial [Clostridiales bacterium]|nr:hypothetical protein [Clostridiales bacterium]
MNWFKQAKEKKIWDEREFRERLEEFGAYMESNGNGSRTTWRNPHTNSVINFHMHGSGDVNHGKKKDILRGLGINEKYFDSGISIKKLKVPYLTPKVNPNATPKEKIKVPQELL